jgi:hypothetical protein
MCQQLDKFFKILKRALLPLTSLLTVGVVSYISSVYLFEYQVVQFRIYQDKQFHTLIYIQNFIFILFPILIFIALGQIVFGDPGLVS